MNKKKYQKPDMTVYKMNRTPLLAGSQTGGAGGEGTYIPHLDGDMNQMA
jgi:hypothetical protein